MQFTHSEEIFSESLKHIPGGVNSPVRAGKAVGVSPVVIARGIGSRLYDEDGNAYIDYVGSYGPLILGHSHPEVVAAVKEVLPDSFTFGAPTKKELEMALLIKELVPSVELVRMVNSGTEAAMSAIRTARGYTGRNKVVKFAGNYHGHVDYLLAQAGSGVATHSISTSKGVPEESLKDTIIAPYNNIQAIEQIFTAQGSEIAAVILELVGGNMGVVPGSTDFVKRLRQLTLEYGALLIVDEVMTGFRVSLGGAQQLYQIYGDIVCFGKIIGGGMPIGAFGGKREIMEVLSPLGEVYQAGTLSGNPIALTAGLTTLRYLKDYPEVYAHLEKMGTMLQAGIESLIERYHINARVNRVGSMLTLFFTKEPVYDFTTARTSDEKTFAVFYNEMLHRGVFLPPSQYEAFFISYAHKEEEIHYTLQQIDEAFKTMTLL